MLSGFESDFSMGFVEMLCRQVISKDIPFLLDCLNPTPRNQPNVAAFWTH